MNKFILHTIDNVKEYDCEVGRIFTVEYSSKLKPHSIHTALAAKIIIEANGIISCFIVIQPLIVVDRDGNISVYTASNFEQATLIKKYSPDKRHIKEIKANIKMLSAKFELGISIKEMIGMDYSQSRHEAMILENRIENKHKGGGF